MNKSVNLPKNIFFIGIGGIHMSAIAKMLVQRGHKIMGTDTSQSKIIEHLKSIGITVHSKHEEKNIAEKVTKKINEKLSGKVVTKISLLKNYCIAEEYHQKYLDKN